MIKVSPRCPQFRYKLSIPNINTYIFFLLTSSFPGFLEVPEGKKSGCDRPGGLGARWGHARRPCLSRKCNRSKASLLETPLDLELPPNPRNYEPPFSRIPFFFVISVLYINSFLCCH